MSGRINIEGNTVSSASSFFFFFHGSTFHNGGNYRCAVNQSIHFALEPQNDGKSLMAVSSSAALAYMFKWSSHSHLWETLHIHTHARMHTHTVYTFICMDVIKVIEMLEQNMKKDHMK